MQILSAITGLIQMIRFLREMAAIFRKARAEGWLADVQKTLDRIKAAKTDDERREIAKELARAGMFPRS